MAFRGGFLVFLRAVSEESQAGNPSNRQDLLCPWNRRHWESPPLGWG